MFQSSLIVLFSVLFSIVAMFLAFTILQRVFEQEYKRPWLFIGISALIFSVKQVFQFCFSFFGISFGNYLITETILFTLDFLVISTLSYGLLLEVLILKFYKGRFVKTKFIPIQEGTLGGEINLNVEEKISYFVYKKDKEYIYTQSALAVKKGFEGFIISEDSPKSIRQKYKLNKTPIAWITQIDKTISSQYLKDVLDENSDCIDPLQLNNLISFIDNFLEQSEKPFLLLDLNLLGKINSFPILFEFLKYISFRIEKFNGILICLLNTQAIKKEHRDELLTFLKILD